MQFIIINNNKHFIKKPGGAAKLILAKAGENHPMYGKTGENSPHFGKTHTFETLAKMS
jgi:hypothetical protein